jgi:hypothetical protein
MSRGECHHAPEIAGTWSGGQNPSGSHAAVIGETLAGELRTGGGLSHAREHDPKSGTRLREMMENHTSVISESLGRA